MSSLRKQSSLLQSWLEQMCQMLPEVCQAAVVFDPGNDGDARTIARWPVDKAPGDNLLDSARLVLSNQAAVSSQTASGTLLLANPLQLEGKRSAVVALEVANQANRQALIMQLLQWGQTWLALLQAQTGTSQAGNHLAVLDEALQIDTIQGSVNAVATSLARQLSCSRLTLGLLEGRRFTVLGSSFSSAINRSSSLVALIEQAMMVAVDRGEAVSASRDRSDNPVELAALLSQTDSDSAVALPLLDKQQQVIGSLLLESAEGQALPGQDLNNLLNLLGPLLQLKWQQQQSLWKKLWLSVDQFKSAGLSRSRLVVGSLLILLLGLFIIPGEHRVTAKAQLEGRIQRSVVAPFEGYIEQSFARAGASIEEGALLARLDDDSLQLERQRWLNQREKYRKEYRKEFAALNHSETRILKAQVAQAEARLQLLDDKLKRVNIVAPIKGVVISGDLSRSLGAPVEKGEVLFQVAPLDEYRLVLLVEERDIPFVKVGQTGRLTLAAQPGRELSFIVEDVATLYEQQEGEVRYRTEARLQDAPASLRPGMGGVGKVNIGKRSIGWITFHELLDWLKLWLWSWLP